MNEGFAAKLAKLKRQMVEHGIRLLKSEPVERRKKPRIPRHSGPNDGLWWTDEAQQQMAKPEPPDDTKPAA